MIKRASTTIAAAAALTLAVSGSAGAITFPTATTGGANGITATGATLHGTVNPNHNATTYSFEYGKTKKYGSRTAPAGTDPTKGNQGAAAVLTGLAPSTTYHYRLTATTTNYTAVGKDGTFKTPAAPPNSVVLTTNPSAVAFGQSAVVSGQVTGPQNAGISVTLQQLPFPFTPPFLNLGTGATDNAGNFSFTVLPTVNTQYQVAAKTKPPVGSSPALVNVAYAITSQSSSKRITGGKRIKFAGFVVPAHDGALVQIEKRNRDGTYRTLAKTLLKHSGSPQSTFSKKVTIHRRGVFRMHVVGDATRVDGFTAAKKIGVR